LLEEELMDARELGARLMQYRKRRRLSITELAAQSFVDYMQISRYEKGQTVPSLATAIELARVLQVSLDELFAGNSPPQAPMFQNESLLERMRQLDQLPADRQAMALRVLDTVITGHELEALSERLRRG
jgi:transcriptional regulator with XRE-family HTH domain